MAKQGTAGDKAFDTINAYDKGCNEIADSFGVKNLSLVQRDLGSTWQGMGWKATFRFQTLSLIIVASNLIKGKGNFDSPLKVGQFEVP